MTEIHLGLTHLAPLCSLPGLYTPQTRLGSNIDCIIYVDMELFLRSLHNPSGLRLALASIWTVYIVAPFSWHLHWVSRTNHKLKFSLASRLCSLDNHKQGGPGSVRFTYGLGCNGSSGSSFQFRRFLQAQGGGFSVFQYRWTERDGSGSSFGAWKTVPRTVLTVPVSGSWATLQKLITDIEMAKWNLLFDV